MQSWLDFDTLWLEGGAPRRRATIGLAELAPPINTQSGADVRGSARVSRAGLGVSPKQSLQKKVLDHET